MTYRIGKGLVVAVTTCLAAALPASAAFAHGDAGAGELTFTIGFGTEPAYAGLPNSVQFLVQRDGEPFGDVAKGMKVGVSFGDQETTLPLGPSWGPGFGTPGDYRAWFVPSQPGDYTFRIFGQVGGEGVDVEMTSGDDTFSPVLNLASATFPAVIAPSNEELADRIENDAARVDEALSTARQALAATSTPSNGGGSLAAVAVVLGAVGAVAGAGALAMARKRV